jgi:hypothetical protein
VLSSAANAQLRSQHEHKQQQYDNRGQNKQETTKETTKTKQMNQFRLLTLKREMGEYVCSKCLILMS